MAPKYICFGNDNNGPGGYETQIHAKAFEIPENFFPTNGSFCHNQVPPPPPPVCACIFAALYMIYDAKMTAMSFKLP